MVDYRHPRRGAVRPGPPVPAHSGIAYEHPRRPRRGAPAGALAGPGWALRPGPDQLPQRFDPEATIRVTANVDQAGRWAVQDVEQAFWHLHQATGLRFEFVGLTALLPQQALVEHVDPSKPSIHVAWAKPGAVAGGSDLLPPEEPIAPGGALKLAVGVACSRLGVVPLGGGLAHVAIVRSAVVLDSTVRELYSPGFTSGGSRGATLLHELAHAVGLDHVDDPTQLMHPMEAGQDAAYAAGDLEGLRRVGVEAGPLPRVPEPPRR